ncbi:MAG: hypothetical protein ACRDZ8_09185 [Acidimicrobiales bacterium]
MLVKERVTMAQAWVDFNNLDGLRTTTLRRFVQDGVHLAVGTELVVGDDEGTECRAKVIALDGELVDLAVDPGTFTSCPVSR